MTPEFEEIDEIEETGAQFHEIISNESAIGERLDKFLADELPLLSRSRIKQLVEKGLVAIDGKLQTNVSAKVKAVSYTHLDVYKRQLIGFIFDY